MSQFPISMPGIGTGLTLTARSLFIVSLSNTTGNFAPSGWRIDGFSTRDPGSSPSSQIRPGLILGQITTTGSTVFTGTGPTQYMYGATYLGASTATMTTASTAFTFTSAASAVELVRRVGTTGTFILTGAPTASGTVVQNTITYSAVNTTTGVVTVTSPTATFFAGSLAGVNDGSQTPVTFYCYDQYPMSMIDVNLNSQESPLRYIPITNQPILTANLINYPSKATYPALASYIKTQLRVVAPSLTFDDDIYPVIVNPTP